DVFFVTGCLGGAAGGLRLMHGVNRFSWRRKKTNAASPAEALMLRQLRPEPRAAWGALLGEKQLASAMIDISDGLSSDLHHLCRASKVGARIDLSSVPCDAALAQAGFSADDAAKCALHGGEDFELLFTVPPSKVARLPSEVAGVPVTRIGEICDRQSKIKINDGRRWKAFKPQGFAHF
ncbi:MAG: AIR synthase-related protein, partial [Pyrinomonadaceae bacterium]